MATISRKTIGIAANLIAHWSQPAIELFFFENDIPNALVSARVSKLKMVLNVFKAFDEQEDQSKVQQLILEALGRLREDDRSEIERALLRDGFVVGEKTIMDTQPDADEERSALAVLVSKHSSDLDHVTLAHHLRESEDLFHQEKWDSSISHCRNFAEQLLTDIAKNVVVTRGDKADLSQPRLVREYLLKVGFFDEPEKKKLVDGVYGYFSEEGSHPGISTQSAARVSQSILLAFAFYVLEKYGAWKTGEFKLL